MPTICVMSSAHPAGDTRIYLKEIASLRTAGYDVVFLNCERDGTDETGVQFVKINIPVGRMKRMLLSPFKIYRQAKRQNADAYHFHDPELLLTGLFLKIKGKKVIYDAHEDVPRQILSKPYIRSFLRKIISKVFGVFEKFCARRCDTVMTATPFIEEVFKAHRCKTITINNYPMLKEFDVPETARQPSNSVAYVGYITQIRGVFELVEAIKQTGAVLELVGSFEDEQLETQVKYTPGWERVRYHGFLGRKDVAEVLAHSRAGVLNYLPAPNHLDAQPNKLFEYMAAGLPVIASDFPLWKAIVEDGDCGICVDPTDPADIARAINLIIDDPVKARKMGENGRQLVMTKYNWETEEKKLVAFYQELFKSRKDNP